MPDYLDYLEDPVFRGNPAITDTFLSALNRRSFVPNIPLSCTWNLLSVQAKRIIRSNYMEDRRRGFSVDDARYFANSSIDILRDLKVGG
jgi:hypothetical protein